MAKLSANKVISLAAACHTLHVSIYKIILILQQPFFRLQFKIQKLPFSSSYLPFMQISAASLLCKMFVA